MVPKTMLDYYPARECSDCRKFRDSYSSPNFGFSVAIPDNLIGVGAVPPAPNHGIRIELDDDVNSYISIGGEYNALDFTSAAQVAELEVQGLKLFGASKIKVKREHTTLCNMPAVHQTVDYDDRSGVPSTDDGVFALRSRKKYVGINYAVTLTTTSAELEEARPLFVRVLDSFKCMKPSG